MAYQDRMQNRIYSASVRLEERQEPMMGDSRQIDGNNARAEKPRQIPGCGRTQG